MDDRELGIHNARQQIRLVRSLVAIRVQRGLTAVDVARKMNTAVSEVHRFESGGSNFNAARLQRYAKAVGATLTLMAQPRAN